MKSSTVTFTFRLDEKLKNEFAHAAKARDRTTAQLLRDYMREFVSKEHEAAVYDAWFRQQVQQGQKEAQAGHLVSNEEVEEEARAWRERIAQNSTKNT